MKNYLIQLLKGVLVAVGVILIYFVGDYMYLNNQDSLAVYRDLYVNILLATSIIFYLFFVAYFYHKLQVKNFISFSCLFLPYLSLLLLVVITSKNIPRSFDLICIIIGLLLIYYKNIKNGFISKKYTLPLYFCCILISYPIIILNLNYFYYTIDANQNKDLGEFDITVKNRRGESFKLSNFSGKTICVDMWSSSCGGCIQSMPQFESLNQYYKIKNEVKIISLFCPTKEEQTYDWFLNYIDKKFPYDIDYYYINYKEFKTLNIYTFPQYLIINKDNKLKYKGMLEYASYAYGNIYSTINSINENN